MKKKKTANAPIICISSTLERVGPNRVPIDAEGIFQPRIPRNPGNSPPSRKKSQKLREICFGARKAKPTKAGII